ncbi:MotA/TolQ/ExbB proton channel family protein [Geovibrio thiophilus]|uniref:MotA/TolQ/ExbB proton channel family protein n=1 Tax=Geovibrio thiophilus TaxID=139438 RepID=A0A3R5XXQ3_9BACT|nr:MotA/TolQ/ExbB proton channel family protein [Geovibrio thiophilus]QAR33783.1 MotA/TolQ/ExbB proton channel family protein [Geovibrio thiophilus]
MIGEIYKVVTDNTVQMIIFFLNIYIWFCIIDRLFFYGWLLLPAKGSSVSRITEKVRSELSALHIVYENEKQLAPYLGKYIRLLEHRLSGIRIGTAAAPMLGLLGTVWGMLIAFSVMAESGTGEPGMIANGISSALSTTMWGLVAAIPGLVAMPFLQRMKIRLINKINAEKITYIGGQSCSV